MTEELINYFKGDTLAAQVWLDKYADEGEITPNDMHSRMAREFARIEISYKERIQKISSDSVNIYDKYRNLSNFGKVYYNSRLNQNFGEIRQEIFDLFQDFRYIIPQGSIMSVLGTKKIGSLSNCYVVPSPFDSYGGILKTDEELVQLMKRRAGVGMSLDSLRPGGAIVNNVAKTSTGADSFMDRYSNTTREVAQEGRRGALMLLLSCNHPSIFKFVTKKKDRSKVTGANVSVMFTNKFMGAVKADEDFICTFPVTLEEVNFIIDIPYNKLFETNGASIMKIRAKELWELVIEMAWENAEPGIAFKDRVIDYSPESVYELFMPIACNPCITGDTEILTREGYYEIQFLIDKEVEIWNGYEWSFVTPKITGFNQHMLKVTLSDGRSLICTDYHKWILEDYENNEPIRKEAINLKIGDKLPKYNFPFLNGGKDIDNKIAYTQGFISADGQDNYNHLWLYDTKYMCLNRLDGRAGSEFKTNSGTLKKQFYLVSEYEDKSFIPLDWSQNSKLEWLSGLFDGDGTELNNGGLQLWSVDLNFLLGVQKLLGTIGTNSKIVSGKEEQDKFLPDGKGGQKEYFCQKSYRICIGATEIQNLKGLGLKCSRLLFNKTPNRSAQRFVTITKIEDAGYSDIVYCFNEPKNHSGLFNGIMTANCGEQWLNAYDSCRLFALNLFSFVTNPFSDKSDIDFGLLYRIAYTQQVLADDLIDLELERVQAIINKIKSDPEPDDIKQRELSLWEKVYEVCKSGRRTGCGITALGDMLAALGLGYDSERGMETIETVMRIKMEAELDATIDMAILRGTFEGWDKDLEYENTSGDEGSSYRGNNSFYEMLIQEFPKQSERMYQWGRRNISFSTIAPTGTVSLMCQTSSGCEPTFKLWYIRRTKINPNENKRIDFTDANGDCWTEYPVLHPKFKEWIIYKNNQASETEFLQRFDINILQDLEDAYKQSPWYNSTAEDIDWIKRVEIQAILQKYTTNAISSTINLPNSATKEQVAEIYMKAYDLGLKGVTVYRDGCRSGVLISEATTKIDEFGYVSAVKRPKEIEGILSIVTVRGDRYGVLIGLINDKPYEVFAFNVEGDDTSATKETGKIVKLRKGQYDFISEGGRLRNIQHASIKSDEQVLTRLISGMLRHGAEPKYVIEQIGKCNLEIVSFGKAISRVLKQYLPNDVKTGESCPECGVGKLIYQEGCKKCDTCTYSAC